MHGVSEVIAIILILMITIAIAGLAYTFMSSTMASTTAAASSAVTTTTSSMLTSFTIESIDIAKVYIRNTGQNPISSLSVYVNDEPAGFSITPSQIAPGQIGTVSIYSFIAEGDTIKITTPSGFSASKKAPDPCAKAIGCWHFDEGSGTTAYDSSPYSNDGTLTNGPTWTAGRYGSGILFDGSNDYVGLPNSGSLGITGDITIEAWIRQNSFGSYSAIVSKSNNGNQNSWGLLVMSSTSYDIHFFIYNSTVCGSWSCGPNMTSLSDNLRIENNQWYHIAATYRYISNSNSQMRIYVNGALVDSRDDAVGPIATSSQIPMIGSWASNYFNGTIDEVRIYNRVIY